VVSVRVRFQDGTSAPAATNGPYFSYVVSGDHTQPGHRPTEIQGFTRSGNVGATQALDPGTYSLPATARSLRAEGRRATIFFLMSSVRGALPGGQIRAQDQITTTPARLVRMFGGTAGAYPRHPVVVVLRGPFTIPIYLQGCASTPAVCPAPVGRWAYFAYVTDPDAYHGGPVPSGAITWLRKAPIGAPYPDLARLGHVRHESVHLVRHGRGTAVLRQHQGTMAVVMHRGSETATTHTQCIYRDWHYRPFDLCTGLSRYVAFRHTPRTDQTEPVGRRWALIEGSLGGWHGCVVLTPTALTDVPVRIASELRRALWAGRHSWHPAGSSPTAPAACRSF
jgi:hypothetical protein